MDTLAQLWICILIRIPGFYFFKIKLNFLYFSHLYSCSSDKTIRVWDMETGICLRKLKSHEDIVNCCYPSRRGPELICSGSDDGMIMVGIIKRFLKHSIGVL